MLSASVEIFPAKMFKHAPNTAFSSLITCYKSCRSMLHSLILLILDYVWGSQMFDAYSSWGAQVPCEGSSLQNICDSLYSDDQVWCRRVGAVP